MMNLRVRIERYPTGHRQPNQDVPWVVYGRGGAVTCTRCGAVDTKIEDLPEKSYLRRLERFHAAHENCAEKGDSDV